MSGPPARLPAARWSTAVTFFLVGLLFATWAARVPGIQDDLALDEGRLALAFLGVNACAVVGLHVSAVVVTRAGSRSALTAAVATTSLAARAARSGR